MIYHKSPIVYFKAICGGGGGGGGGGGSLIEMAGLFKLEKMMVSVLHK